MLKKDNYQIGHFVRLVHNYSVIPPDILPYYKLNYESIKLKLRGHSALNVMKTR